MTKAKRDALYAELIRDRAFAAFMHSDGAYREYLNFLRAQSTSRHNNVYYAALKQIEGR